MNDKEEKIMTFPAVSFLYGLAPKKSFGVTWPVGTEVIVMCHEEDRDCVQKAVEQMGYKIASFQQPTPGCPAIRKWEYQIMKKPKPVIWKPREWEGEKLYWMKRELAEKGIEL